MGKGQHVLLTGPPGVGKTTVVRKVVEELKKRKLAVNGFFTQEVREPGPGGRRTGFEVVTVQGQRATLASVDSKSTLKVGNYGVEIVSFELSALPTLAVEPSEKNDVLIIDEIGKMELFSNRFKTAVDQAFAQNTAVVLATIPVAKGRPIPFVEKIRNLPNAKLFTVSRENRNNLADQVLATLLGNDPP